MKRGVTAAAAGDVAVAAERDAVEALVDGLRDLILGIRRSAAGDVQDRAAGMLLLHLSRLGPIRATELAERSCLDASTVSRHLSALEDAGYLARSRDPHDGRAVLLDLSPAGRQLVTDTQEQRVAVVQQAIAGWPGDDVETLTRLVRRLADAMETA